MTEGLLCTLTPQRSPQESFEDRFGGCCTLILKDSSKAFAGMFWSPHVSPCYEAPPHTAREGLRQHVPGTGDATARLAGHRRPLPATAQHSQKGQAKNAKSTLPRLGDTTLRPEWTPFRRGEAKKKKRKHLFKYLPMIESLRKTSLSKM